MIAESCAVLTASDGITLEARVAAPPGAAVGIVVCHPHPLYGGDMDNPVVVRAAGVWTALGFATLRFNFRGVGASSGIHDEGRREQADVEAALHHLAGALVPPAAVGLAGYSFGARVAAAVAARRPDLWALVLVAPATTMAGLGPFTALSGVDTPLLVVAGTADEYCPGPALDRLAAALPRATVRRIEGANHFFSGKLFPLGEALGDWTRALWAGQAIGRGGAR